MSNKQFTESPAKFLSIFVERMVPDYVREDHPKFIEFLRAYFEYLERETGVNGELGEYKQLTDLIENIDIDHAMDQFIPEFEKQYLPSVPHHSIDPTVPTTDKAFLAKNIQETYREKGTVKAIDFLFRRDFNTDANIIYPKQYMMSASGSVWYEPKWILVSGEAETIYQLYDKRIIGQTSGATAFVDIDTSLKMAEYEKLLITEVEGSFLEGEEVWEDVGSSGLEPIKVTVTSDGIVAPGTCYINGEAWSSEVSANIPETRNDCESLISQSGVNTSVWLPNGYWLDSGGFLSSDRKLQDNDYYQDFSYVVKSDVPVQSYREVLKKLVHPVGLKLFAEYMFQSTVGMDISLPENFSKYLISIFTYLDVAMDIWDAEDEQHGTLGHAHTGFGLFLEDGFNTRVVEILKDLDVTTGFVPTELWAFTNDVVHQAHPEDHFSISIENPNPHFIGNRVQEKLYTVATMNDDIRNFMDAFPEATMLEFTRQLRVLDFTELPGATAVLEIFDNINNATDGGMIGCEVWELLVSQGMESILKWIESFVAVSDYAPDASYRTWELNRENSSVQHVYGLACDIIDAVPISSFAVDGGARFHAHGGVGGFAPLVETTVTKGFEVPVMNVNISAFHTHYFDGSEIKNLIRHGKEVTARGISYSEARDLMNRDYFEIPHMHGANLVCGGIMTPPLWGDWVDSQQDPRYNGYGECFNSQYDNPTDCISAYGGNQMFWMPPMCSNMSNMSQEVCEGMGDSWVANPPSACSDGTSPDHMQCEAAGGTWTWETPSYCTSTEASCNAAEASWGYFTLESLPTMKGHVSYFVKGQVVDRQRGRTADPLTREQARQLIDGDIASVTLYDNVGYLDDDGHVFLDEDDITIGGTITNIRGEITSGHYHEYTVTYDADWETKQDWRGNDMTHGFVYTPITTFLCFNYDPSLPVDPTKMGGMDFLGNQWPQNVFLDVPDSYVGGFLMNPDITLQHNQVWPEELNPNVDWVELYSSNHIAQVPGIGATGDLIGVTKLGIDTDTVVIEAYPGDVNSSDDFVAIVDQSGIIKLLNETTNNQSTFMDLTSLQHVIGLGPFANYDERGVLGLAFHPDYSNNGKFYVYYMTEQGGGTGAWGFPLSSTVISEFSTFLNGEQLVSAGGHFVGRIESERVLLTIPQPDFNHNGGELAFGPDGMLYIGLGDGGSAGDTSWSTGHGGHGDYGNAQDPTNLLGTILRIDVTEDTVNSMPYTIPADNPFVTSIYKEGQTDAQPFKSEIYAYGFRNPWRFSFAPDGKLWCADVGQDKFEEINIVESGGNYGWRVMEAYNEYEEDKEIIDQIAIDLGFNTTLEYLSSLKSPIHEYSHGIGISVLGGFVYDGSITELRGKYIFGDWATNWGGTTGHLYALTENFDGNSANFNILANPVNGATHGHTFTLTGSQVQYLKDNPGSTTTALQTDTVHAEFYTHLFTVIWSAQNQEFFVIGQTNPEGHDVLEFIEYGSDLSYDRTPLSIWDPVTEVVDLTTMGESILTMGETKSGEIIFSTRTGIDTFQGSGSDNTTLYKITESYNTADIPVANEQIPAMDVGHVHGYKVTWDDETQKFSSVEISDIQMDDFDPFWPVWTGNDPASHIHPVDTVWSYKTDIEIPLGSSAGWHYNEETATWEPYDIGADTAWAPPVQEEGGYVYITTAPSISVQTANEHAKPSHLHYFNDIYLDTFGQNYGRKSATISRFDAELTANNTDLTHTLYSSIFTEDDKRHYHEYEISYSTASKQFIAVEVAEWHEPTLGTGEFFKLEIQTHEHGMTVDGVVTSFGWNGLPVFAAPTINITGAHNWSNLDGSLPDHYHYFNESALDSTGPNSDRTAITLTNEETTNLMNGTLTEVTIYSSISGDHYHGYNVTYVAALNQINVEEVSEWLSSDGTQYFLTNPSRHKHGTTVNGLGSSTGYNQSITPNDLPLVASPSYPYPGGSHPHFHNNTVVGPFPDGTINYAHGLNVNEASQLIDGIVDSVVIYDSIEGAHFHEYTMKWDDVQNKFYVDNSITWIRGGIEDVYQDSSKYYVSTILNESEGLHWHNLTVEWNPDDEAVPQQTGGAIYITRTTSSDEVLVGSPQVSQTITSTELNPVTTNYPDIPNAGDTTSIVTYSDQVNTTVTTTTPTTTTTTLTTYLSNGTDSDEVLPPVITEEISTSQTSEVVEDLTERKTFVNNILQANNAPVIWINPTFLDGEGSHDHLLYNGCTLDTEGTYVGRMCEPVTLAQANMLINAQDSSFGFVFYDSPNGNLAHYHSYALKFNPNIGVDGAFTVSSISMFDRIGGSGSTVHKFKLTGGFHTHDYEMTPEDYVLLLTGNNITMTQLDAIHADLYTHDITIRYSGGTYNLVGQTSDFDNHDSVVYQGAVASGGEWVEVTVLPGDHIHTTVIDESNVWPVPV